MAIYRPDVDQENIPVKLLPANLDVADKFYTKIGFNCDNPRSYCISPLSKLLTHCVANETSFINNHAIIDDIQLIVYGNGKYHTHLNDLQNILPNQIKNNNKKRPRRDEKDLQSIPKRRSMRIKSRKSASATH